MFDWQELIEHLEEQNIDAFTEAVKMYDSISRLDQWYTTMLVRIKKQINDNPDLRWAPPIRMPLFVAAAVWRIVYYILLFILCNQIYFFIIACVEYIFESFIIITYYTIVSCVCFFANDCQN